MTATSVAVQRTDYGESTFALCWAEVSPAGELVIWETDTDRNQWFGPVHTYPPDRWAEAAVYEGDCAPRRFINPRVAQEVA